MLNKILLALGVVVIVSALGKKIAKQMINHNTTRGLFTSKLMHGIRIRACTLYVHTWLGQDERWFDASI